MVPVLLVTRDESVRDAVLRLAALVGTPVHVESPGAAARSRWRAAGLVVVGADCAADPALPRRAGVVVVTDRTPDVAAWERAVGIGAEQVLELPSAEPRLLEALAAAIEPVRPRGAVIGVVGGCGGAGASTLAVALGLTAARTGPAVLIDADPVGGGLDLLLAAEHQVGARWSDLVGTRGRLSGPALLEALPHTAGLAVLSWDRADVVPLPAEAAASVLEAAARATAAVVVDLPRHLDAGAERLIAGCDEVLVVVPATVRATAAAARIGSLLSAGTPMTGLVVCDVGAPRLAAADVATALGLRLRATVRFSSEVAAAARHGRPPPAGARGPLGDCCRTLLASLTAGPVAA
jgi:secretion/DNA translocation related CpaE-like protein